jgi:hypothetical protein
VVTRTMSRLAIARLAFLGAWLVVAGCGGGGGGGAAALPLGKEAVVDHTQLTGASPAPKTTLAITVLAVRTGTIAELEAGGYTIEAAQKTKTPIYVDVRYENRGTSAIDRNLDVSLEDQDGNLITSVVIFNYGETPFPQCTDNGKGSLAPGEKFDTCTLFLVDPGRTPTKVSFLPYDPGKETQFVYWSTK